MTIKHLFPASLPELNLDFANAKQLDPRITFTRASTGTYTDENGILQTAAVDEARFDHAGDGTSLGLLIEEARTNLFLNSAALSTQTVTVAAGSHALSFYGTGTVTLSGDATGTLVGTGDSDRVSLVVTAAAAGSVTATVTGTVTNAQFEAGAFPTSYIPTTGATATREADFASMTGTNFSSWYNQSEGTLVYSITPMIAGGNNYLYSITDGTGDNRIVGLVGGDFSLYIRDNDILQVRIQYPGYSVGVETTAAAAWATDDAAYATDGVLRGTDTSTAIPTVNRLDFMSNWTLGTQRVPGHISRFAYYPVRLPDEQLQALTA